MSTASSSMAERNIVDKAWDAQEKIEQRVSGIGKGKYGRVIRMARKPTPEEFRKVSLVSTIGILFLGAVGFLIFYGMESLTRFLIGAFSG